MEANIIRRFVLIVMFALPSDTQTAEGDVRLVNGHNSYSGRVEVYTRGSWETVCDGSFGHVEVKVICKQLGHFRGDSYGAIYYNSSYGKGSGEIIESIQCYGSESSLSECYIYDAFTSTGQCDHDNDVGIDCQANRNDYTTVSSTRIPTTTPTKASPIRLVNGTNYFSGRVETFYDGEWGTMCDDHFSIDVATVMCRMLGLPHSHSDIAIFPSAYFGEGTGRIDDLYCYDNATDISNCIYRGHGIRYCKHSEDAGVRCGGTNVGLVGGTDPSSGRIEILYKGQSGTVCDSQFDENDAMVVCRMLGFPHEFSDIEVLRATNYFGRGYGPIIIDDLECNGTETDIGDCPSRQWLTSNCSHDDDVGIRCGIAPYQNNYTYTTAAVGTSPRSKVSTVLMSTPGTPHPTASFRDVRLNGGNDSYSGRVEVYTGDSWKTVCDGSFSHAETNVICRQLGRYRGDKYGAIYHNAYYGRGAGEIIESISCQGSERSISWCYIYDAYTSTGQCTHDNDVGIDCEASRNDYTTAATTRKPTTRQSIVTPIRLVNGTNYYTGRIEIYYHGEWGTLCDDHVHNNIAVVMCRLLGLPHSYSDVTVFPSAYFGEGFGRIDDLYCDDKATDMSDCMYRGHGIRYCKHSEDAGVRCGGTKIALAGGPDRFSGRVELFYNGQWGTICDNEFDEYDAMVVCKMLGFPHKYGGMEVLRATRYFGRGNGPIIVDDLECNGTEADIADCPSRLWLTSNCSHGDDVGIRCGIAPLTPVRLIDGPDMFSGRVEVFYNGSWGTICDDNFDQQDALVICRMLNLTDGYSNVVALTGVYFGAGHSNTSSMINKLNCSGNETDIADCASEPWLQRVCPHSKDAGVNCRGPQLSHAIDVRCDQTEWSIDVNMEQVRQLYPSAVAYDIYLGDNRCTGSLTYNTLRFRSGLRECLTSEIIRNGVFEYSNELVYAMHDPSHNFQIISYNWTLPVECDVYPNSTSHGHLHHTGHSGTTTTPVVGYSQYSVNMTFYSDPNFMNKISGNPLQVKPGTQVYVKAFNTAVDWTVKMRVHTCYITPAANSTGHLKQYIIKDGCEVDTNTHFISQNDHETKFVFQDFDSTTNQEGIDLHCDARFCDVKDSSTACSQTCQPIAKRGKVAAGP